VVEAVTPADAAALFAAAPVRVGAAVLAAMLPVAAARVLAALDDERAMALLAALGARSAVLVLRHVDELRRARLIAGLPTATAVASRLLLGYPEDSAGAWADPNVLALSGDTRAGAALERLRAAEGFAGVVFAVDSGQRLAGLMDLADLLRAPETASLDTLMRRADAVLAAQTPLAGAAVHPGWLTATSLPVIEADGRLLGVLTSDALARALGRSAAAQGAGARPGTIPGVFAQGYWAALSGIVEAGTALLPPVRPVGRSHER
jgi:magnesium transporter